MAIRSRQPKPLRPSHRAAEQAIVLFAACAGILAGLALLVSGVAGPGSGYSLRYPLEIAEPQRMAAVAAAPSIAVHRTPSDAPAPIEDDAAKMVTAPPSASDTALAKARGPGGMLNLDYDLAKLTPSSSRYDSDDGSVETDLPLLVNGANTGAARIRIEGNAQILIATSAVADAVGARRSALPPRLSSALETRSGFIPFHELRAAGFRIDYDPVKDQISLSLPS